MSGAFDDLDAQDFLDALDTPPRHRPRSTGYTRSTFCLKHLSPQPCEECKPKPPPSQGGGSNVDSIWGWCRTRP